MAAMMLASTTSPISREINIAAIRTYIKKLLNCEMKMMKTERGGLLFSSLGPASASRLAASADESPFSTDWSSL
jgi:hypothetical protein